MLTSAARVQIPSLPTVRVPPLWLPLWGPCECSAGAATVEPAPSGPKLITLEELQQHATPESAWLAIDGKVYDLTSYAPSHPGGASRIYALAGTDGTMMFNAQHGPGSMQAEQLASYYLADFAN